MNQPQTKIFKGTILVLGFLLGSMVLAAAGSSEEVLSQKILLENTIHQRVSDAVYRILRNDNYIVNVKVEMDVAPTQEYTTVYETGENGERYVSSSTTGSTLAPNKAKDAGVVKEDGSSKTVLRKRPIQTTVPSDIPGFPGIQKPGFELFEEDVPVEEEVVYAEADDPRFTDMDTTEGIVRRPYQDVPSDVEITEEAIEGQEMGSTDAAASADIKYAETPSPRLKRHTVASTQGHSVKVKRMQLTIILEDPATPQIVENIRTVAMVASHFNRERGDVLQVMTAPFSGSEKQQADAEELLLKSIADKMTAIEARQKEEEEARRIRQDEEKREKAQRDQEEKIRREEELKKLREAEEARLAEREEEMKRLREAEAQRLREKEEELDAMRAAEEQRLADERRRLFEAEQEQARERLRQDSLRLALLTEQLSDLKNQLSSVDLEEEQRLKMELEQKRREAERQALQEQQDELKAKLADLENPPLQTAALPNRALDSTLVYLILGGAILLAFAIALAMMMSGRRRRLPPAAPTPTAPDPVDEPVLTETPEASKESAPEEKPTASFEEEALVMAEEASTNRRLRDEVDTIKKSVVSMAVSKPQSASNIIHTWLQDSGITETAEEGEGEEAGEPVASEEGEA